MLWFASATPSLFKHMMVADLWFFSIVPLFNLSLTATKMVDVNKECNVEFIILYHNILVMLYDGHPYSIVHEYFNCVVKTVCLDHVSMERPFRSCIRNVIFSKSSLKTVSMYGSRVLVFDMWSIVELFRLSVELQVVMILHPHVLLYWPYIVVL